MSNYTQKLIEELNDEDIDSGYSIFKDENTKAFVLFKCIIENILDRIKKEKIITTKDFTQKMMIDIGSNFFEYLKNLSWYSNTESQKYTVDFYNDNYTGFIIKQTEEIDDKFIKDLEEYENIKNEIIKKYKIENIVKDNIPNLMNKDEDISVSFDKQIPDEDIKNDKVIIIRKIYVFRYKDKNDLIKDYNNLKSYDTLIKDKIITKQIVDNNPIYFLYIKYKKNTRFRKYIYNGTLSNNPFHTGLNAKNSLLKNGKELKYEELLNSE